MKSKKELDLHRLTRNNAWGGFIVFLVLTVIISMLMAATGSAFLSYVFESKIKDQYRSISSAVKMPAGPAPMMTTSVFIAFTPLKEHMAIYT